MGFKRRLALTATLAGWIVSPACAQEPSFLGYAGIPNIKQTLSAVGNVANQFDPGINSDTVKVLAGVQLNDASLSGFGDKSGIIAYCLSDGKFAVFMEIAEGKTTQYATYFKKQRLGADVIDGMVLVCNSKDEATMNKAKALAPKAKEYLTKDETEPRIEFHVNSMAWSDAFGLAGLETIRKQMDHSGKTQTDKTIAVSLLTTLLKQINAINASLSLNQNTLALNWNMTPVAGTAAAMAMAKQTETVNFDLLKKLPKENIISRSVVSVQAETLAPLADDFSRALGTSDSLASLNEFTKLYGEAFTGRSAAVGIFNQKGTDEEFKVYELKDPAKVRPALRTFCDLKNPFEKTPAMEGKQQSIFTPDAGNVEGLSYDSIAALSPNDDNKGTTSTYVVVNNCLLAAFDCDLKKLIEIKDTPTAAVTPISLQPAPDGTLIYAAEWDMVNLGKSLTAEVTSSMEDTAEKQSLTTSVDDSVANLPHVTAYAQVKNGVLSGQVNIPVKSVATLSRVIRTLSETNMLNKTNEKVEIDDRETSEPED